MAAASPRCCTSERRVGTRVTASMTRMPSRMAPRTQAVEAEGGAVWGVRGRAASAGLSLPAPGRLGREAPGRDCPGRLADDLAGPVRPAARADEGRPGAEAE